MNNPIHNMPVKNKLDVIRGAVMTPYIVQPGSVSVKTNQELGSTKKYMINEHLQAKVPRATNGMTRINRRKRPKANAEHLIASHIVPVRRYGTVKTGVDRLTLTSQTITDGGNPLV